MPNAIRIFTNILDTNSWVKCSKPRRSVRSVEIFSGDCYPLFVDGRRRRKIDLFLCSFRGFAYRGFQCQICDCVLHRDCYEKCTHPCPGRKQTKVNKPHHFEHQSFSLQTLFCDHDGSFIKPRHAYKCSRK